MEQNVPQTGSPPFAVHDGCVAPVNSLDFLQERAHRVSPITGALQRTGDCVLPEFRAQLARCEF